MCPARGVKSRPAACATSVRKARRNASFSSVPCQLVPQVAADRQPPGKAAVLASSTVAVPWWISYPATGVP